MHPARNQTSTAIELPTGKITWVFDAGEHALKGAFDMCDVQKIFVTHMHGDHVFGLPGLICKISAIRANTGFEEKKNHILDIYGPVGLSNFIRHALKWTHSKPSGLKYRVHEFGGRGVHESPFDDGFLHPHEISPVLLRNDDAYPDKNVWRIDGQPLNETSRSRDGQFAGSKYEVRDFDVVACEIRHVRGIQTLGYVLQEPDLPRKLLVEEAERVLSPHLEWLLSEKNMDIQEAYRMLKREDPIPLSDGTTLDPNAPDVNVLGPKRPGRKICILGDTCDPSSISEFAADADVLVHEATYYEFGNRDVPRHIVRRRGHSTARMAGEYAAKIGAKRLILNHVPSDCRGARDVNELRREAASAQKSKRSRRVSKFETIVPWCGDTIDIPYK
eukprot:g1778.t1